MVFTNHGRSRTALLLGGSSFTPANYFAIGSGSGTALVTQTTLLAEEDRQTLTATTYPSSQKVKFQADWNSVEMSGLELAEWSMMASGAALTGSIWSRTSLPSISFDGTNELRIEETWEVFWLYNLII